MHSFISFHTGPFAKVTALQAKFERDFEVTQFGFVRKQLEKPVPSDLALWLGY